MVFECQAHGEYWNIIDEGAPDHQLPTLLGATEEVEALAEFVKKSKAFQNQKTQTNRKEILAAKQRDQRARGAEAQSDAPSRTAIRPTPSHQ